MKRHKLPRRRRTPTEVTTVMGIAWYRPEQWERLREISSDSDDLEDTYEEWVRNAENSLREMRRLGKRLEKVDVDVEELLGWCRTRNYNVDGEARARYAAEKLQQLYGSNS